MRIVNIEQSTDVWLDWRRQGLGSTDIAAISGLSKYKTAMDVFEDKKGLSFPILDNHAMAMGRLKEPEIRDDYNKHTGTNHIPICVESLEFPFLKGSLDGFDKKTNSVLEVKFSQFPKMAIVFRGNDVETFKDSYMSYFCQVQYFMYLTKSHKCDISTQDRHGTLIYMEIPRDDAFIKMIVGNAKKFWIDHIMKNTPPGLMKGDFLILDDQDAVETAKKLKEVEIRRKTRAQEEKKDKDLSDHFKAKLVESSDGLDFIVDDIKMTRVGQNRVDTKRLYMNYNITEEVLNEYRTSNIGYWKVNLT